MDYTWLIAVASLFCALLFLIFWLQNQKKYYATLQELHDKQQRFTDESNRKSREHEKVLEILQSEHCDEIKKLKDVNTAYSGIIDKDKEIENKQTEINDMVGRLFELNEKYKTSFRIHKDLEREIDFFRNTLELHSYGLYKPQYNFDLPEQYKVELEGIYQKQKDAVYRGEAVVCSKEWMVDGSKAEGKKMTNRYIRLVLYAFNGECDSLIAKVKWNNVTKTIERIRKAYEAINKLGEVHSVQITYDYLKLKLAELSLTHEYAEKKYEEKEEQRRIREMMREEEKAQKEYERAQREAEEEEKRFQKALERAKQQIGGASGSELSELQGRITLLEKHLKEAEERKQRAISLAQTTKVGHIYVISNIGAFGEDVYKIGMTRRLDPMDRVKELGDASVPFQFDVHAIIYSENAPQLEWELHKHFHEKRLNRINGRKEFFKVSLDQIEAFIKEKSGAEIQITKLAEAKEYRETLAMIKKLDFTLSEHVIEKFPENLFDVS